MSTQHAQTPRPAPRAPREPLAGIDPRGPQFTAALTVVVLVAILATASITPVAIALTALQTAFFAIGALRGVQHTPHAALFRRFVRPRLAAPAELEDPAPPRFAQAVGLVFTAIGLLGLVTGALPVAYVALGLALVAATLNAVFAFCLGCEMYLLIKRFTPQVG